MKVMEMCFLKAQHTVPTVAGTSLAGSHCCEMFLIMQSLLTCLYKTVYSGSWVQMFQINVLSPSPLQEKPCCEVDKLCRRGCPGSQRTGLVMKSLQRWDLEQSAQNWHCWIGQEALSGLLRNSTKPQNRQLQVGPFKVHRQRKVKTCPWHIFHSFTTFTLKTVNNMNLPECTV